MAALCPVSRKPDKPKYPRRAIVLAAGLGQRMRPLSLDLPKPIMPLWNRPLLEYTLRRLADWGVTEVLINLHHGADAILQTARKILPAGIRLTFSFEPSRMDTGGALGRAAWFFKDDHPVWIVNSDIYCRGFSTTAMESAMQTQSTVAALWMHPETGPRTVSLHADGTIRSFSDPRPGSKGTMTFCGISLVSPRILAYIPDNRPSSLIDAYRRAIADGHRVCGIVVPKASWIDMGTPSGYLQAHGMQPQQSRQQSNPAIPVTTGRNTRIGPGCRLENCVLWDNVTLLAHTTVRNTVIGRGVTLGGRIERPTVALACLRQPAFNAAVAKLGWPDTTAVTHLDPRGSARSFYRLHNGRRTAIMVHEDGSRHENRLYARQTKFLGSLNLPAPELRVDLPEWRVAIYSDGGDRTLQEEFRRMPPRSRMNIYRRIIAIVLRWHTEGSRKADAAGVPLMPAFSRGLFAWELDYFDKHCLRGHFNLRNALRQKLLRELREATQPLRDLPEALLHRDLQSGNILLPGRRIMIIDYQGMRFGPAVYDLASLLYDPYVPIQPPERITLLDGYMKEATISGRKAVNPEIFHRAGLQRLAQALGAFARLGANPDTRRFGRHIPAALSNMRQAAGNLDGLPALSRWLQHACE